MSKYNGTWHCVENNPPRTSSPVLLVTAYGGPTFASYNRKTKEFVNKQGHEMVWPKIWTEIPKVPKGLAV